MDFTPRENPWNLPPAVQHVCHLLVLLEYSKLIAKERGTNIKTVERQLAMAVKCMKVKTRVGVAREWDRFVRGDAHGAKH